MADKTYKNLTNNGYTTYHSDGSSSNTYKNITDDGYTTYHSDGSSSNTYKNITDDGYTTYHSDGSSSNTYKNITGDGYTTYHTGDFGGLDALAGFYLIGAFAVIMLLSLLSTKNGFFCLILIISSIALRIHFNNKLYTSFFSLWFYPISLLGWRLLVNNWWNTKVDSIDSSFIASMAGLATIVVFVVIFISLTFDYHDSFILKYYLTLATFVMFFAKGYGKYVPYYIIGGMILIALISTPFWITSRKSADRKQ